MQTSTLPIDLGSSPPAWDKPWQAHPEYTIGRAVELFPEKTNVPGLLLLD
jgi:hypothetical protein